MNWLASSTGPDDVVVDVATYGSSRDLDTVGVNYIITHDTVIDPDINPDELYATALTMVEIANAIATRAKAGDETDFSLASVPGASAGAGL